MKIKISAIPIFLSIFILSGCGGIKKMYRDMDEVNMRVEPEVLEVHGDSVEITFTGEFPDKTFNKKAIVKVEPVLTYGDEEIMVEPFYLKGENVELSEEEKEKYNVIKTIKYSSGGSFEHTVIFPFDSSMLNTKLEAYSTIKIDSKYDDLDKCITTPPDSLAIGTITTSLTVKPTDHILLGGVSTPKEGKEPVDRPRQPWQKPLPGDDKDVYKPKVGTIMPYNGVVEPDRVNKEATIHFLINSPVIRPSEKKDQDIKDIEKWIKDNPKLRVSGVIINSYASPDGELERNQNLSKQRAENTFDYMKSFLKSKGFESVHDSNFYKKASTDEDWDGFKKLVKESDLSEKQEILSIANSNLPPDEKEAAIRKLDSWEPYLVETLLPKLRRSEIKILGYIEIRDIDTIRSIAKRKGLDQLTKKELILLALKSNDPTEQKKIYEHYRNRFPDDWVGHNNMAAYLLMEGKFKQAYNKFSELKTKYPDNPTIANNFGVANRFMRNYDTARMEYTFAAGEGIDESNNMGILDIKVGDYASAISNFEDERCDYNVGLAYTLYGDYEKALEKIECIEDKTADVFYLRAIVAARKGDQDLLTTSIRRAVELDPYIRDRAKKDHEFRKYRDNAEFQNAIR